MSRFTNRIWVRLNDLSKGNLNRTGSKLSKSYVLKQMSKYNQDFRHNNSCVVDWIKVALPKELQKQGFLHKSWSI